MAIDVEARPAVAGHSTTRRKRRIGQRFGRDKLLVVLGLPGAAALILFQYVPLLGNIIAFQDFQPYTGIAESPFIGLDNFKFLWDGNASFLSALTNTLILTVIQTVFVFPVPLALALLLSSLAGERLKRLLQSILYLPHFLSWVIVVAIFQQMLGNAGMLNTFLVQNNLPSFHIIGVPEVFMTLLTSQAIWKDAGWGTIIFLAAISQIDQEQYEASAVDGANAWQRLWNITLPSLKGIFILLLILRLGTSLSVGFEQIILQQGLVGLEASEVLDTWVYNNGIVGGDWGMSTAVGLVKSIIGILMVVGANKLAHKFGEQGVYQK
ncbi:ABC transporter permease [Arthrobacter bambusae]|uniref:Aldouronate transport system permease protein n=1 Tax=Arthrobacter bambusae TaxID=1338426 RepID=A0AAW8DG33_9MICC|nr:ABC transporter permease subunit [Arthrobacter bambusae]MDP9905518.1 putative aldouronate transport system permease protein [Arthrobacter bambusae]MDQ0127400.1 putative aldouronate transport system permease protein [Arthrobacter bambusae]MDQ0178742.1 putative aldouronate transport system permease protein [Arthrobacter bambusae]